MKNQVDKPIRHIVEEFNKSRYIKTVFSCGGHFNKKYLDPQVYIQFEMEKKYVGKFLAIAFSNILAEMFDVGLKLQLDRAYYEDWPMEKKERLTIHFSDLTRKLQMQKARDYFHRLSLEVAAQL